MFYVVITLVSVAVLCTLLAPLWTAVAPQKGGEDIAVYKAQLREVEKDLARGVLTDEEAEAARLEVSRRLLAADKQTQGQVGQAGAPMRGLAVGLLVIALAATLLGYQQLGRPDLPDQPLAARLEAMQEARLDRQSQAEVEALVDLPKPEIDAQYTKLLAQLRAALEERPEDIEGLRLLVQHEANTGHFKRAHIVQAQLIDVLGEEAGASDFETLAEFRVIAANGYVSPEAEAALTAALSRDPSLAKARYYSGLLLAQTGRPDMALGLWQGLLREGPEDAPWIAAIRTIYNDVALQAGQAPLDVPGPSAADVEAAEHLSDSERMEMIEGMVAGLSERLATEGGSAAEWARLIRALGVLGRTGEASAIWNEAREVFAEDRAALDLLRSAAQSAEIAQ